MTLTEVSNLIPLVWHDILVKTNKSIAKRNTEPNEVSFDQQVVAATLHSRGE